MLENKYNKNPFNVPENYFRDFNSGIMDNLPEKKPIQSGKRKVVPLWKSISKWAAAAAVVSGMAFLGTRYIDDTRQNSPNNIQRNTLVSDENIANDYYQFLEEEATRVAYRDAIYNEDM
jgi:hypothetical protein